MVFHLYFWIAVFVWAHVFCGARICLSDSVDCSGAIQKINVRKIRLDQGVVRAYKNDGFHDLETFHKPRWPSQSPGVRADAQCCKITWLEELASESNTIQAQEDITQAGKIAGQDQRELYVIL